MPTDDKSATTIIFRPGWLVIDQSTASGGVRYERRALDESTINRGNGIRTVHRSIKTVDHVEFCAAIDALVKRVDYALRKHGTRVGKNWFVDSAGLKKVEAEVAEIAAEAARLNTEDAAQAMSGRRAYIGILPMPIDFDRHEAVREIARTIRETLTEVHDALRAGAVEDFHKLKLRCINIDRLAVGMQADAIRFALERFATARRAIKDAAKVAKKKAADAGASPAKIEEAAVRGAQDCGAALDLEAIQVAIDHFLPSVFALDGAGADDNGLGANGAAVIADDDGAEA